MTILHPGASWSNRECNKPCGGGVITFKRNCLYPQCIGESVQSTSEECNTHDCVDHILTAMGGTVQTLGGEKCTFPFLMKGIVYDTCIPSFQCAKGACKHGNHQPPTGYDAVFQRKDYCKKVAQMIYCTASFLSF